MMEPGLVIASVFVAAALLGIGMEFLSMWLSRRSVRRACRRREVEVEAEVRNAVRMAQAKVKPESALESFTLRLAERIYAAHEVLAKVAEKKQPKPVTFTETDYCPL